MSQIPSSIPSLPSGMMQIQAPEMQAPEISGGEQISAYVGDLSPGESAKVTFRVKVDTEADQYPFGIKLRYFDESGNEKESKTLYFGVKVEDKPKITVSKSESQIYSGSEGVVQVTLKNIWNRKMDDTVAVLKTNPPLTPLISSVYVGDISPGESKTVEFRIKASEDARPSTYPAEVYVKFTYDNETLKTDPVTFGMDVGKKMEFSVKSSATIEAGKESIIQVEVTNSGEFTVRDASARLTVVDPFTSTDDTAFLGDLKPGESKSASFKLKVEKDAIPKTYALNLEVKYRDTEGEWVISDPVKVPIKVVEGKKKIPGFQFAGAVISLAIVFVLLRRKA